MSIAPAANGVMIPFHGEPYTTYGVSAQRMDGLWFDWQAQAWGKWTTTCMGTLAAPIAHPASAQELIATIQPPPVQFLDGLYAFFIHATHPADNFAVAGRKTAWIVAGGEVGSFPAMSANVPTSATVSIPSVNMTVAIPAQTIKAPLS